MSEATPSKKFISWNVNGFRSILKKGFMEWLEEADPDVLNLQEIRCEWDEVDLFAGFLPRARRAMPVPPR